MSEADDAKKTALAQAVALHGVLLDQPKNSSYSNSISLG